MGSKLQKVIAAGTEIHHTPESLHQSATVKNLCPNKEKTEMHLISLIINESFNVKKTCLKYALLTDRMKT